MSNFKYMRKVILPPLSDVRVFKRVEERKHERTTQPTKGCKSRNHFKSNPRFKFANIIVIRKKTQV